MTSTEPVFALLNMTGTSNVVAALPLLAQQNPPLPLVAPFTGAQAFRSPVISHLFNIRASYADETEKIVQHLVTLGTRRIAVVWSNNGLGKDGLAGVQKAMEKRGLKIHTNVSIEQNASDTDKAVSVLYASDPQVVVMIAAGSPTVSFIKAYNKQRKGMKFYTLSVMGTQATLRSLGTDGVGVVVSTVVPFPWDVTHALAKEYRGAMDKSGFAKNVSFLGFESYINAKVFVEGLRIAGRGLTRPKFVSALASIKNMDLNGGFRVDFSGGSRQGSQYVGLVLIGSGEKFTK
jgi:branched-chain amino acid transport system substrate-binding protein